MARTKTYQHFCPVARSLEVIGEKWSLLIVRDLLTGPLRFTDLMKGLSSITPKWLTLRLRELEAEGIVERSQEEGRREVWYRLTPRGRELSQVVGALNVWGLKHAMRAPQPGEALNGMANGRLLRSFEGYLIRTRVRPAVPMAWELAYTPGARGTFRWDGSRWHLAEADATAPDARLEVEPLAWAELLALDARAKRERLAALGVQGDDPARSAFVDAICAMSA